GSADPTPFGCNNSPIDVTAFGSNGIDCSGATDSTAGWAFMIATLPSTGATLFLPSGCMLRFVSPGTVNPAMRVPNNTHILCADESAGFTVNRQTCHSGQYIGAPCNTDAECTQVGGGSGITNPHACQDDFGHASGGVACTSTT